jgi:hypothetical protein
MHTTTDLICSPLRSRAALRQWVRLFTGLDVPAEAVCPDHDPPMDYLATAYFEPARDQLVWAPRGGGKTRLAAAATLLDLLHKPPAQVRILGGSLEQSLKTWEYLLPDLERLGKHLLKRRSTARRVTLIHGGGAAVLTQSQRAVRGLRVQKLRCDELELFDPDVWSAAQLATRSLPRGRAIIRGSIEGLSTCHVPGGLMERALESAAPGVKRTRWCLLEVLARCDDARDCGTCALFDDCRGVAKVRCSGFVSIDDAIAMKRRVSAETWAAEMLCRKPSSRDAVFPSFDPAVHVRETSDADAGPLDWAIDFGFANPFVCLFVRTSLGGLVHVIDEYVQERRSVEEHLAHLLARGGPLPRQVACDPAGSARNEQTAASNVQLLRRRGLPVRHRASRIVEGVERIRALLRSGDGQVRLLVHPRCRRLVAALRSYRYPPGGGELPIKDGTHDHLIDALRYHLVNTPADPLDPRRY